MKNVAVIVGGGMGKRFKGEVPKQFLPLGEKPIIFHTIEVFQRSFSIDSILVVVPEEWIKRCTEQIKIYAFDKVQRVIAGGETRQLSCWQALQYLKDDPPLVVVVHDAGRPLVSATMIEVAVKEGYEGMTFGLCERDTIVECSNGEITKILPREQVYHIQTPQSFPFCILWDSHCKALKAGIKEFSDDAGLVMRAGYTVKVIEGDPRNIKITGPVDLQFAEYLLQQR
jgi:2-C-methyl-D-erythritol 4-phosphate cytidylyltransferase